MSLLALEGGQPLQVLTLLLALTSAMLLFLLFVILGLLVVKWGRRRFPYVLKQRKAHRARGVGEADTRLESGQLCRVGSLLSQGRTQGLRLAWEGSSLTWPLEGLDLFL